MSVLKCEPVCVVGIDVSKDTLAVCEHRRNAVRTIRNARVDVRKLVAEFAPGTLVICEPTGGYEALLLEELSAAGVRCHRTDTLKVKAFARSFGCLAKTDAIDARLLAAYGADRWKHLPLYGPAGKTQTKLAALVARRQDLMAIRGAELNRSKAPGCALVTTSCKAVLLVLERQMAKLDREITALCVRCHLLARRIAIYQSLPGVGPRTAIALAATMPELGTLNRRQAASLAGLAPHPKDSGTLRGYRNIRGGRPQIRSNLFMAALAASRANGQLRTFYQRLIENGKKPIVALTAVMRKIIVILNARSRELICSMS